MGFCGSSVVVVVGFGVGLSVGAGVGLAVGLVVGSGFGLSVGVLVDRGVVSPDSETKMTECVGNNINHMV